MEILIGFVSLIFVVWLFLLLNSINQKLGRVEILIAVMAKQTWPAAAQSKRG